MVLNTVSGKQKFKNSIRGVIFITTLVILMIFSISLLIARTFWESEIARDQERELIYRANHIVKGIERYYNRYKKYPDSLMELVKERYIRKLYSEPVSDIGLWNYVMVNKRAGKRQLTIVPNELILRYIKNYNIVGVCSSAVEESYMEYRKVKYYYKWAFYVGAKENEEMPELRFISTL